tara:strand:+ start:4795 stop:6321 length:1527 start_codon:yes stop_codon:yes gene_type:complete
MKKNKVLELNDLLKKIQLFRKLNPKKKVVLCHGIFDILHIGHLRYFKEAKKIGDFVVASVTADKHVIKGLNRPYFNDNYRSEFLNSIEEVNAVYIDNSPSALNIINKLKPDYYLKGDEYSNLKSDLTKKIYLEKKAVIQNGGKLVFSKNIVFSSSNLINNYFQEPSDNISKYIKKIKNIKLTNQLIENLQKIKKLSVLVIGETIVDKYIISEPLGKPGKDTHLVIRNKSDKTFVGGSAAVAKNVSSFSDKVTLLSCVGEKKDYLKLINSYLTNKIKKKFIYKKDSPTIVKKRFIEEVSKQKLFGEYLINDIQISKDEERKIINFLKNKKYDLAIVLDYGHGFITKKIIQKIRKCSKYLALNAQINSSNIGHHSIKKLNKSDLLIINESELRHEVRDRDSNVELIAKNFAKKNNFKNILITMGASGSMLVDKKLKIIKCPAFETKYVVDKIGAGDTMLSVVAPLFYLKNNNLTTVLIGNLAGAVSIRNLANSISLNRIKLIRYYQTLLK